MRNLVSKDSRPGFFFATPITRGPMWETPNQACPLLDIVFGTGNGKESSIPPSTPGP